jgi:uncharacterized iron-regulated membrane protein
MAGSTSHHRSSTHGTFIPRAALVVSTKTGGELRVSYLRFRRVLGLVTHCQFIFFVITTMRTPLVYGPKEAMLGYR